MYVQLPPLREDKILHFPHFPTVHQCVIFRNWGLVPVNRIAKVLGTDTDTVKTAAAEMGLDPDYLWNLTIDNPRRFFEG